MAVNNSITAKLEKVRKEFPLLEEYTFLNCASHPPLSIPVRKRLDEFYDLMQYTHFEDPEVLFGPIESSRRKLADMFGCQPAEIAITPNTSYGINIAAWGLDLSPGDSVLLPDIEFPANVFPFLKLRDRGVKIKFIKNRNGLIELSDIKSALTPDVRLFSISWVQFLNGARNDLNAVSKLCEEKGVFFSVDGIQGTANIPIDLSKTSVDLFSAGAEKWFLTPCGVGFCYLSNRSDKLIRNHYSGWLGVDWGTEFLSVLDFSRPFKTGAARFEIGTYPYQEIAAFETSLDILIDVGVENIFKHTTILLDRLIGFLKETHHYRIISPLETSRRSSILSFACDDAEKVYRSLIDKRIITSFREGAIRVSPHLYNNMDDIDLLIDALKKQITARGC